MTDNDSLRLHRDILFRAVPPEGVLVDQRVPSVMVVNGSGLRMLELIRACGSRQAVIDALVDEYDAPVDVISADVDAFLSDLRARNMLA
ncbi:PqqD family protein [Thiolapillus sp.]